MKALLPAASAAVRVRLSKRLKRHKILPFAKLNI
jgi:hypothetical protein